MKEESMSMLGDGESSDVEGLSPGYLEDTALWA
jgi:hypothetical protein